MKPACAARVTESQGQGHQKRYKMTEVNGAYTQGMYETIWIKSLCVMSSFRFNQAH